MQFYAFVAPGLEEIAQREIAARLGAEQQGRQRGVVFFATDAPPQDLLDLGTTEDVFALVARGPYPPAGKAFRLVRARSKGTQEVGHV